MSDSISKPIKGIIPFPCCPKEKVLVYEGTYGLTSNKCPRCGKFALFDLSVLNSKSIQAVKGSNINNIPTE